MEYNISTNGKTFAFIAAGFLITSGTLLALYAAVGKLPHDLFVFAIVFALLLILIGAYIAYDAVKIKLVITDTQVELTHAFSNTVFLLTDVKGYRTVKDNMFLILKEGNKAVRLPKNLQDIDNIKHWAESNFGNANKIIIEEERQEILADENFGATPNARLRRLNIAKLYMYVINTVAVLYSVVFLFLFNAGSILWTIMFALPCTVIITVWRFKGLIKVNITSATAHPSLFIAIFMSVFFMLIKTLNEYTTYEYMQLFKYIVTSAIVMTVIAYSIVSSQRKYFKKPVTFIICSIFISAIYSYSILVFINCYYDKTSPQVFNEPVIDKYVIHGKNTSYNIVTPAWGRYYKRQSFSIGETKYSKVHLGDTVFICLYSGRLHIPWYYLKTR